MKKKQHITFLKDPDFIAWRLTGDPSLEIFWEDYITNHPEEKEDFENAIREFSKITLNKAALSAITEDQLLDRIHSSVQNTQRKMRLLWTRYVAAACIVFAIGISFYHSMTQDEDPTLFSDNIIVWDRLEEKDISLITDDETTTFSNDIQLHIEEDGSAVIEESGSRERKVIGTNKTKMNKLVVPYGKRSQLTFADGTRAWINSGSVVEFPSAFTGKTRTVSLIGEMYLEVAKDTDKPFIVRTEEMQIQVYGTKFNISTYHETTLPSVILAEGSVGVKSPKVAGEIRLTPNDMLTLVQNRFETKKVDVSQYLSWKEGYLSLTSTPIDEVIQLIGRYYNLSFQVSRTEYFDSLRCTGKIYLSEDINNVMETLSLLTNTTYKHENKTIYLDLKN